LQKIQATRAGEIASETDLFSFGHRKTWEFESLPALSMLHKYCTLVIPSKPMQSGREQIADENSPGFTFI
jgi:hypothetical protein